MNNQKRAVFEEYMKGDHVLVFINTRTDGLQIPGHLLANTPLTLKLSYLFQGEITHDEEAITAYLKFNGEYFKCVIPWQAILAIKDDKERISVWEAQSLETENQKEPSQTVRKKPTLTRVK